MAFQPRSLHGPDYDTLQLNVERVKWMLQQFTQGDMPYYEPALVSSLDNLWQRQESCARDAEAIQEAPTTAEVQYVFAPEKEDMDPSLVIRDELDPDLLLVFLE